MTETEQKLAQALLLLAEVQRDFPREGSIVVRPGDNLPSILEIAPAESRILLMPGYTHVGDLDVVKPMTLVGGTLVGATRCLAPRVTFDGVSMTSRNRDQTLLTTGDGCTVDNCSIVGSQSGQHRGIAVNSADVTIRRTTVRNIWHSLDAQAIGGWDGTSNLLVEDCPLLEASGENIIFGGADPSSESRIPSGIQIRRCLLSKPTAWMTLASCTCKNLFELKNARGVLVEDVTMENSFVDGQIGFGVVLTVRNQNGGAPWSTIEDVTMRRITLRHVAGGVSFLGLDDTHPSREMSNVLLEDWTVEDVSRQWGANQRCLQFVGGGRDITLSRMRFSGPSAVNSFMQFNGTPVSGLTVRDCDFDEGLYGIFGTDQPLGVRALDHYAPNAVWSGNTVRSRRSETGRVIRYPDGTTVL